MNTIKSIIVLSVIFLTACNIQNTKTDPETELVDLISLQQKANTAYQNRNWEDAIKYYKQLTERLPNDSDPWFRMGNSHARLNQTGSALQAYQAALVRDSKNSKIWHNMGIIQLQQSTKTFVEMQKYTTPGDPLNIRAQQVIDAITKLLNQDFGIETTN